MSALPPDDPFQGPFLGGSWDSLHEQARSAYIDGELALAAAFEEEASVAPEATEAQIASSLMHRARCLDELDRHAEELAEYDHVIQRFQESEDPEVQSWVSQALINRGITLSQEHLHARAIEDFDLVIARWQDAQSPELAYEVSRAFHFRGLSLASLGRHEEAAVAFQQALARLQEDVEEAEFIARIHFNLGRSLIILGRGEEALQGLEAMLQRHLEAVDPDRRNLAARALMGKAFLLFELKRHEEEITLYDLITERFEGDPDMQEFIARALFERAIALGCLGRREDEIAQYAALAHRFENAEDPTLRLFAAKARVNRGCTLHAMGLREEALGVLNPLAAAFEDAPYLLDQTARALGEKASILDSLGRHEEELKAYDELITRLGDPLEASLARRVAFAYSDKAITLRSLNRLEEAMATLNTVIDRFGDDTRTDLADPLAAILREKSGLLDHTGRHEEELQVYGRLLALYEQMKEDTPRLSQALWARALTLRQLGRFVEAEQALAEIADRFASSETAVTRSKAPAALLEIGILQRNQNRLEEAEAIHRKALVFLEDADPEVRLEAAKSAVNLANILRRQDRDEEALAFTEAFLQREGAWDELLEPTIRMSSTKASILEDMGRREETCSIYRSLVDRFANHPDSEIRSQIVEQLFNLAIAHSERDDPKEELATYFELLQRFGSDQQLNEDAQEWIASAMLNQACVLHKLDCTAEALEALGQLMKTFGSNPERSDEISRGLRERASILDDLGRHEEEIAAYDELIQRYEGEEDSDLRRRTIRSLLDRGLTMGELDRPEDELASYSRLAELCAQTPENQEELAPMLAQSLVNAAEVLADQGRYDVALSTLERLLAMNSEDPNVAHQQGEGLRQKAALLDGTGESAQAMAVHDEIFRRFQTREAPEQRAWAAGALFDKALTYANEDKTKEEVAAYELLIQTFGTGENLEMEEVQEWVAKALLNQALEREIQDEPEAAMEIYRQILSRYPNAELDELRAQVAKAYGLLGILLEEQGRRTEAQTIFHEALEKFRNDDDDDVLSELALSIRGRIHIDTLAAKADILRATAPMKTRLLQLAQELDHAITLREDEGDECAWSLERAYLLYLAGDEDSAQEVIQEALEDYEEDELPDGTWTEGPKIPADQAFRKLLEKAWKERE